MAVGFNQFTANSYPLIGIGAQCEWKLGMSEKGSMGYSIFIGKTMKFPSNLMIYC